MTSPNLQRPLPLLSIIEIAPSECDLDLPQASFDHQATNFNWNFFGPFPGSCEFFDVAVDNILSQATSGSLTVGEVTQQSLALPAELCTDLEFGSIEIEALLGEGVKEKFTGVMVCKLVNTEERLVRVHHDRNFTRFYIGDKEITETEIVKLPAGSWPITLIFDNDRGATWQQLWVAPRFHNTTEAEVQAWNDILKSQLELALEANKRKEDVVDEVAIDWSTAKGSEGFIRAAKSKNGYWWFLNADNKPFYFSGATSINRAGTMGGRLAKPGDYAPNVDQQFNWLEDKQPFVDFVTTTMKNAGFNGFGSWTTEEFFGQEDMYITDNVQTNHIKGAKLKRVGLVDVFDPYWKEEIDKLCADICGRNQHRKNLVGYFIDNEIGGFKGVGGIPVDLLGNPILDRKPTPSLLQQALAEDPSTACYKATWSWVLARHDNDLATAFKAWEREDLTSQEDVTRITDEEDILHGHVFDQDADDYALYFAEEYLKHSAAAIRKHDPNHLVLGVRWAAPISARHLVNMEQKYCDVISMNNYRQNLYERVTEYGFPDVPVLNGEFAWTHDASMFIHEPNEPSIGYTPNNRMWKNGMSNLMRASSHPNLVGWTWYRWVSNKRGRREDGIVGVKNNEIVTNTSVHARLNARTTGFRVQHDNTPASAPVLKDGEYVATLNYAVVSNAKVQEPLTFGFQVKDGKPASPVYGVNAQGEVKSIESKDGVLTLHLELELCASRYSSVTGPATYTITLESEKLGHYLGQHTGTNKQTTVQGHASIWTMDAYRDV